MYTLVRVFETRSERKPIMLAWLAGFLDQEELCHEATVYRRGHDCRAGDFRARLGATGSAGCPGTRRERAAAGRFGGATDEPDAGRRESDVGERRQGGGEPHPSPASVFSRQGVNRPGVPPIS